MANADAPRAKVFISCGQRTDEEKQICNQIAGRLNALGFDTYIAVEQQSLDALKANIFRELDSSEYVLFVDFLREELRIDGKKKGHRGSLFCNQELAIASYLELDVLAFQEVGVVMRDGLLSALHVTRGHLRHLKDACCLTSL